MNDPMSWDPALVKKFSSSNHLKMLNQLKNEVIKYPLNNKKKSTSIHIKDSNQDNKNNLSVEHSPNELSAQKANKRTDENSNKSNVSFNNSKNFSIYNQTINNSIRHNESPLPEQLKSDEDNYSPTFKERLNQIDMK